MVTIWNGIAGVINQILSVVFFFLPLSPFKQYWTALADNEVIPVSYTHLDVYKRQAMQLSSCQTHLI